MTQVILRNTVVETSGGWVKQSWGNPDSSISVSGVSTTQQGKPSYVGK